MVVSSWFFVVSSWFCGFLWSHPGLWWVFCGLIRLLVVFVVSSWFLWSRSGLILVLVVSSWFFVVPMWSHPGFCGFILVRRGPNVVSSGLFVVFIFLWFSSMPSSRNPHNHNLRDPAVPPAPTLTCHPHPHRQLLCVCTTPTLPPRTAFPTRALAPTPCTHALPQL